MRRPEIVIAVPKGRILGELMPLFDKVGLKPEASFYDENSRQLSFSTNHTNVTLIRVRSFDVATFVAFGAADLGVAGKDVLMEFEYPDLYAPVDLQIGHCRMSLAAPAELSENQDFWRQSHIRVATKYVNITRNFFAQRGIQAECIKLNGALEIAPQYGLCQHIVDLVSTGGTLKANGLKEMEVITEITSRLIVHRGAYKTRSAAIGHWVTAFEEAVKDGN
ncbi:MAG: ATP phosphoribosyltransferase [Hyphomicrobiales bacterium]|nr:ATP phosphoribosyltransferase [Rickettsiales bacterium]MCP5361332.1 ATP phosphoribosyltransferase [Hyphomicrobiales bacterium]